MEVGLVETFNLGMPILYLSGYLVIPRLITFFIIEGKAEYFHCAAFAFYVHGLRVGLFPRRQHSAATT